MKDNAVIEKIRQKYARLFSAMDCRLRRQWAAAEAMEMGWGGVTTVALATGLDRHTILAGTRELRSSRTTRHAQMLPPRRSPGGGRKPLTQIDPGLPATLDTLLEPADEGPDERSLRWTCKSTSKLARELQRLGHPISDRTVASLLQADEYTLQAKRSGRQLLAHTDCNTQFQYINEQVQAFQKRGEPVIWVETKAHAHHKPRFAVDCIRRWWQQVGARRFPSASTLLITSEVASGNRVRNRSWRQSLQDLANEIGLCLEVCHFPPATTKWNKTECRLSSAFQRDCRGKSWTDCEVVVYLIGRTALERRYLGTSFKLEDLAGLNQIPTWLHGDWNFIVHPLHSDLFAPFASRASRLGHRVIFPNRTLG
jgi:hypothetical protein